MPTEATTTNPASAFRVTEKDDMKGHLWFWTREEWKGEVPPTQAELRQEFDDCAAILRARFAKRSPDLFKSEFERLLQLAHAAFSGDVAQVAAGQKSLQAYKNEVVRREGPTIKNEYLKELAIAALFASVLILGVAGLIRYGIHVGETKGLIVDVPAGDGSPAKKSISSSVKWDSHFGPLHFGFLLAANMWGIWLSFVFRNLDFRFEQLQHPESDLMRPWSRLLSYGMLAFILALFFQMQVLVISVGGVSTSQICDNAVLAVFVGLALGFTDKALPGEVKRRIEEFFQSARTGPT